MALRHEDSVSPTSSLPRVDSTIQTNSNGTSKSPSRLRTELSPDEVVALPRDHAQSSTVTHGNSNGSETTDYINGGLPHEGKVAPQYNGPAAGQSSPARQYALKHTSSFPKEALATGTTNGLGTATPPGRRSVQFARPDQGPEYFGHVRQNSWDDGDNQGRKGQSLMSKLKSLASTGALQTHSRNASNTANSTQENTSSVPDSPVIERSSRVPHTLHEEGSDADADAEETADEDGIAEASRQKKKRRFRRPKFETGGSQTAPTTPRLRTLAHADSPGGGSLRGIPFLSRRATDGDMEQRGHLSEGEGRDRLQNQISWRRGSSFFGSNIRNLTSTEGQPNDLDGTPAARRPSNIRRAFTGLGGGQSEGEAQTPRRPFLSSERATTFSAQKWRVLKNSMKMFAKKDEQKVDYLKSAELMAELRAGAPAALILASMIQRDEHGNKRIPVLLEQLKLRITDSKPSADEEESERHLNFRIELEYGSGLNRMKWVIYRSLRDFANLHIRYKLQGSSDKVLRDVVADSRPKQPRFPKSAFPYFRAVRGLGDSDEDEPDAQHGDETAGEATHSDTERKKKKRRPSLTVRRSTKGLEPSGDGVGGNATGGKLYKERQRKRLEQYLQEMIRWLIFRADSNRLCRFLELSALGVRLAAEGSYHGKEGYLAIQSSKGLDVRRILTPKNIFQRHSPKWFLVRHSYMVCVDSPENMHIYDVYLADSKFEVIHKHRKLVEMDSKEMVATAKTSAKHPQHHRIKISNSERKLKLLAKNEKQLTQFEESIRYMLKNTQWSKPNRFGSFAPVRTGVHAQWLVDGRDYMWNVSRAINMAKDVIYIHDWWLSPQLYMRRPAAISQKWRLDRLLQAKARQGVKVFIIIYRNVEAAIPIDSEFTKFSMLDLHPNIFVQRSPNQFKKNQFFYAHHEKICIVDHIMAFVGGIDLCFGRWDTPQHSVVDDKPTGFEQSDLPKDADHCQLWPGKDYSNPRVQDFFQLNEPYAEMYDRSKTPRMPWHDISMQVVGQPARDLTRHFVQRWNYVLRGRKPTRPTPFLLPPPDYTQSDLESLGLTGTCEVQILRSASDWSLGLTETEHSIMNAYCKMIEESEHYVYMENQFFISSCETMNVKIVNKIGDAIVERATRAYQNNDSWRCVIVIPLMPGFQNTVEEPEGTSVRLIMQCQFRSICRGEGSIFGRLRSEGIDPEEYVSFFSLRTWGRIGPKKMLVTEQLYIHAKAIIVDDRVALIGSANINERSMLGVRDSECAAIVRDTDMLWSTMDGEPYLVGRFAHTLRMRLMREHLGLDVDEVMEEERRAELDREEEDFEAKMNNIYHDADNDRVQPLKSTNSKQHMLRIATHETLRSFNHDVDWEEEGNPNIGPDSYKPLTTDRRVIGNSAHAAEVDGEGHDQMKAADRSGISGGRDSVIVDGAREVLVANIDAKGKGTVVNPNKSHQHRHHRQSVSRADGNNDTDIDDDAFPPMPQFPRRTTEQLGLVQLSQLPALPPLDDTDIGGPPVIVDSSGNLAPKPFNPLTADIKKAIVGIDSMRDPLNESFYENVWLLIAENNTKIFRRVFRCNPDSEVQNWHEYTDYIAYAERFAQSQAGVKSTEREQEEAPGKSGPPGVSATGVGSVSQGVNSIVEKVTANGQGSHPLGTVAEWAEAADQQNRLRRDTSNANEGDVNGRLDGVDEKDMYRADSGPAVSADQPNEKEAFPTLDTALHATSTAEAEKATDATQHSRRKATFSTNTSNEKEGTAGRGPSNTIASGAGQGSSSSRRRRRTTRSRRGFSGSDDLLAPADVEELLSLVQGHLVLFPYDWLIKEELNSNWLYQVDQVAPLQI